MAKTIFSIKANKLKKKYGMAETEYLVYADLRACGWSIEDAWNVAFQNEGVTWPADELKRQQNKLESLDSVQQRMADTRGDTKDKKIADAELSAEELARETSKDKILADLVIAKKKMTQGTKEWIDTTKMIGDFTRIKQDELQTEDTTIHYFLPISFPKSCDECPVFLSGTAKAKNMRQKKD